TRRAPPGACAEGQGAKRRSWLRVLYEGRLVPPHCLLLSTPHRDVKHQSVRTLPLRHELKSRAIQLHGLEPSRGRRRETHTDTSSKWPGQWHRQHTEKVAGWRRGHRPEVDGRG